MKKKFIILIIVTVIVITAVTVPLVIFNTRAPVLIVLEEYFIEIYGEKRLEREVFHLSLTLFRSVKIVTIANEAGDDIIPYAVMDASARPYCVFFPIRLVVSAGVYRELNPNVNIVILEGRSLEERNPSDYFLYKTDIDTDFYKAGLAAAAIVANYNAAQSTKNQLLELQYQLEPEPKPPYEPKPENNGKAAVFVEPHIYSEAKEAFLRGFNQEIQVEPLFFTSFIDISNTEDLACVVLAGIGGELLEKIPETHVIVFSWMDPEMMPTNVLLVIDDSPLAQVTQAIRMINAGEALGIFPSKLIVMNYKGTDRDLLKKLKKIR
ncbi:MAG: hypothetical protein FWD13_06810 [Treponema sp.]|nr:hypothetical protein [Treponema sp.]